MKYKLVIFDLDGGDEDAYRPLIYSLSSRLEALKVNTELI